MQKSFDSNDDSSDNSSDEEYLTGSALPSSGGGKDREALIRKKLLESFYGKASGGDNPGGADAEQKSKRQSDTQDGIQEDDEQDNYDNDTSVVGAQRDVHHVGSINLDSTHFVAEQYTKNAIESSSAEQLLSETEKLATEIRGLDSTMQTLVYENYSKFIDATDAIRSIGRSVGASDSGLRRLAASIQNIERGTLSVDTALKESREAVAEKLRIKRHLVRLDALLKLPQTMRLQISSRNYRSAAKNYASAMPILAKHSGGFESLAKIESECNEIMKGMKHDLTEKLESWGNPKEWDEFGDLGGSVDATSMEGLVSGEKPKIQPPKNIAEIFECAGTLLYLSLPSINFKIPAHDDKDEAEDRKDDAEEGDSDAVGYGSLALNACSALLSKSLETHEKQKKGASVETKKNDRTLVNDLSSESVIPKLFLENMLEAATLFGVTFADTHIEAEKNEELLPTFVMRLFTQFLQYTQSALQAKCEACIQHEEVTKETLDISGAENKARLPTFEKKICLNDFDQVSKDLSDLVKSVREVASGLALPEVGLEVERAGLLVDQTIEMCDGLIQRHIVSHFAELRSRVISKCVLPFVRNVVFCDTTKQFDQAAEEDSGEEPAHDGLAALAPEIVGDVMEMADAAISDIALALSSAPVEMAMVQQLIQKKSFDFSCWFAAVLEVVAGCEEVGGPHVVLVVSNDDEDSSHAEGEDKDPALTNHAECVSDNELTLLLELLQRLKEQMSKKSEESEYPLIAIDHNPASPNLALAAAEACRIAANRLPSDMIQSVVSVSGGTLSDEQFGVSIEKRFNDAASNALFSFVVSVGDFAVSKIVQDFQTGWPLLESDTYAPRPYTVQALEVVKNACLLCESVFGFQTLFPPISGFSDNSIQIQSYMTGYGGNVTGLQLDVERMFAEKLVIHGPVSFEQDSIVSRTMRIIVKGMLESARATSFSRWGCQQMQLDVEIIRNVGPHFMNEDEAGKVGHLLDDVLRSAEMRCDAVELLDETEVNRCLSTWWDDNLEEQSRMIVNK